MSKIIIIIALIASLTYAGLGAQRLSSTLRVAQSSQLEQATNF